MTNVHNDCPVARDPAPTAEVKGVICKVFGVMLVFIGILNSLLSWRGGAAPDKFHLVLMIGGLALFGLGVLRALKGRTFVVKSDGELSK